MHLISVVLDSMATTLSSDLACMLLITLIRKSYSIVWTQYLCSHTPLISAMFFAISAANARKAKGEKITPAVCMVEAIGTTAWRTETPKIWVPHDKIAKSSGGKNDPAKLKQQEDIATCSGFKPSETVRFSVREYHMFCREENCIYIICLNSRHG